MNKIVRVADYFGVAASTLCLIHCLGMPLILSSFPLLGLVQENIFHQYMAMIVTLPVLFALIPGFIVHRRWLVLIFGGLGLVYFISAVLWVGPRYGEIAEIVLSVIGSLHLFVAHLKNHTFCQGCLVRH